MLKFIKQRNGVTLIELIVTLALVSVVLVAVFNLFLFNHKLYDKSDSLSQVQFDVRMASDMITRELRNVSALSLSDTAMTNKMELIELKSKFPSVSTVNFKIGKESSRYLVEYTLVGTDTKGENEYILSSRILLNNITSVIIGTGNTLYYN